MGSVTKIVVVYGIEGRDIIETAQSIQRRFFNPERVEIINIDDHPSPFKEAREYVEMNVSIIVTGTKPIEAYKEILNIADDNNIWPLELQM